MVVERSPIPPLPEFHVLQFLLSEPCQFLKDRTEGSSTQQGLGTVWRHRTEWNRDALTQELPKDVKEVIEEVGEKTMMNRVFLLYLY